MMKSWIDVSPESHFPIQNLPMGIFSTAGTARRAGVAIGDFVLDLLALHQAGAFSGLGFDSSVFGESTLNSFMAMDRSVWRAARARVQQLLLAGGDGMLESNLALRARCLHPTSSVQMHMPATVGDYTDFYSSREHATNVGIMFRGVDNALQPNWLHLPVGYHGRSSSVNISGTDVVRPTGQLQVHPTDATQGSTYGPCKLMDFELEMAFFVGGKANPLGQPIGMDEAEDRIFGVTLMNDWSARDIQKWEYVPLGPFTAKNFSTTISPWIVSLDALEPFRCSSSAGPVQHDPSPLPYITDPDYHKGAYDIKLSVAVKPADEDDASVITRSNYRHMYWNMKQQLVHHAVTGCNMEPGDLLGSGTISGADETAFGSMLELCWKGAKEIPLVNSPSGAVRKFLKDGDECIMDGFGQGDGFRVGFGIVRNKVLPAGTAVPPAVPQVSGSGYSNFKLHSYWRSTSSWRVRIALALKGVQYETIPANLATLVGNTSASLPALAAVNSLEQVPVLTFDGPDGVTHSLTQSMAILDFLDAIFPNAPMLPADPLARARCLQIAELINSNIQPGQNLSVLRQVKTAELVGSGETVDGKGLAKAHMEKGLAQLEQLVAAASSCSREGSFAAGTEFPSLADLCLVPQLYNAHRFGVDMAPFPSLVAMDLLCGGVQAFQAARPEGQPDAPPS